ncbi:hypothetical protein AT15_09540 [Kosmotoga arenicorallina S304]|uniref:VWFA domain-containing protein n=1 Tax=Kosmotoga arenicorallina S304 TaxID=1453497 RepID=A0A176K1B1_9BACT|nr:vWA domain-containing protein [Kosmotoga arenicorallina]OAA30663.1 hypothetical protein AT15_09540 [Kosmotoga arenicorallina S304]
MKIMTKLIIISVIALILASCGIIPVLPLAIPLDPIGVKIPVLWGNDLAIFVSVDRLPVSVPIINPVDTAMPVKLRMVIKDYAGNLTPDNLLLFEDGKAQGFVMVKESEVRIGADIVFLVDVTGSMGTEIQGVKNSMMNFLQDLEDAGLDVKVGIVPYGDYVPASPTSTDNIGFDPPYLGLVDPTTAASYTQDLDVGWGADGPENAYGAIMFAWDNMSWRSGSQRVIIWLTDAWSHYTGDQPPTVPWPYPPSNDFDPKYTKADVISTILGYATVHIIASTGDYYFVGDTDFTHPGDPREIVDLTGGLIIYQDPMGEPDLSTIGITEYILSSWLVFFETKSYDDPHNLDLYIELPDTTQGQKHLVGVTY